MPQVKGKSSKMDWKSFAARSRIDVSAWVAAHGFKSYSEVKAWCEGKSIEAPPHAEVRPHLPRAGKKKAPQVLLAPAEQQDTQADPKKTPLKRKRKSSNG